jgi:hypothetical protein
LKGKPPDLPYCLKSGTDCYFHGFALSIAALMFVSVGAQAQEDAGTMKVTPQETPAFKRNTIELRPFETAASAIPGVAASGATFETAVTKQWAAVVGGSYTDVSISRGNFDQLREETNEPIVNSGYGYSAGVGVRYYEDPIGDSTYAGGHLDYSEIKADWNYENNDYVTRVYGATPSLVVGYRWVWQNGIVARLGAGAGVPVIDSQSTTSVTSNGDTAAGVKKIETFLDQNVMAKLDLGLGYTF